MNGLLAEPCFEAPPDDGAGCGYGSDVGGGRGPRCNKAVIV